MGAGPFVLVLVGMVIPVALLLLAVVVGLLTGVWALYQLWHGASSSVPTERRAAQIPSSRVAYHH